MFRWQLKTPVAFIIFNRPDTTAQVFSAIAQAKPPKLLVVGDGPRPDRKGEIERCLITRAIVERVDWNCEVVTNYSDTNLGCKRRVATGIDWVFQQADQSIILEDDCVPHPTFFRFCEELLERYKHDERISQICGANFQLGRQQTPHSYYFSKYHHIWGWASWRRAWRHYDADALDWPRFRDDGGLDTVVHSRAERKYWTRVFQAVYEGKIDTWDYQWGLAAWSRRMLSIVPSRNLVRNIGFGVGATHTRGKSIYADLETEAMDFPLAHPDCVIPNESADSFSARNMFTPSLWRRALHKLMAYAK